jgi:multiple sugar transport system ATP-binding protein
MSLGDITKEFGNGNDSIVAVDDVSLEIDNGEFLVLVGPSGCGKSTTLRMIAGLESITGGELRIDRDRVNEQTPQERDIAMVFQSYALYPHMTVRGNMRFGLEESTDLPDSEIDARVEDTASMLGIESLLDRQPSELSGGQQQRVALGRAIVREPKEFLMDEPLSNLDAKLRSNMRTELQRLQNDLDTTTVYVTHDQTEAMTMGDRIAVLDDGQLQQVGVPLDCYHEPQNRFVAGFLGEPSMNFFAVERDDTVLRSNGFNYPLSSKIVDALGNATSLTLGIRPSAIEMVETTDEHAFAANVDVVEPMGDEYNVHLTFDDADTDDSFVATIDGMCHVEGGQRVAAHLSEDAIHLFDRESEEALWNRRTDRGERNISVEMQQN